MITCTNCGTANPDDHRFCKQCGTLLTQRGAEEDDDTVIIKLLESHGKIGQESALIGKLWLLDQHSGHIERVYELSDEQVIVGRREDCAVCLSGNTVSRRHAQIRYQNGQYFISDLNSTNGTLLNNEATVGEELLRDRDEISIGVYKLIFRLS
ncbi:MAG TPA: FHA domain-containing protein [Armatimonadota bacterium]|nr:FHA domain-containing protein [Armatimonadota bacterium]